MMNEPDEGQFTFDSESLNFENLDYKEEAFQSQTLKSSSSDMDDGLKKQNEIVCDLKKN